MGFGQTQFPRQTSIVDRTAGSCTGTAVITGDQDDTCASLGNTGSDCSDTGLRYQLYRDSGLLVGILQIIDQLCQVLNGVDIVVRRRRNQCHTGCGMSGLGNPRIHFLCRKMTALARLCALCHLDLDFLGGSQILGGNTEPSGSHLLDGRALIHSTAGSDNAFQIFTALTAVGLTADAVHGDCHALVCLLRNGTVGHCARLEPAHDALHAFDLFNGNTAVLGELEVQCAPEGDVPILGVDTGGVLLE